METEGRVLRDARRRASAEATREASHAKAKGSAPGAAASERVHVVGIAGSGLRGMAQLLHARGAKISGSEQAESPVLERLRRCDIDCRIGHKETNITPGVNLVVVSAAVDASNPEVRAARDRSIPVLKYAECLGKLMTERVGIAIAGTHGKTTTSSMTAQILLEAGVDPSFLVGGDCPSLGGSARWGAGPHFVAEACEFDRSFLNLRPKLAVITNVDEDHLDYFRGLAEIQRAFGDFVRLLPADGLLVLDRDDPNSTYLRELTRSAVSSFSLEPGNAEWWAEEIRQDGLGTRFVACHRGGERQRVHLHVPGLHNVRNALAATALCRALGIDLNSISRGLGAFRGVRRRFEVLAEEPVMVIDDYAHHPTEVDAVVSAARDRLGGRRLIAVFQPHQHSRLKYLSDRFATSLAGFDEVLVLDVFRSRDSDEDARTVQSDRVVERLGELGVKAWLTRSFADARQRLEVTAGAGDVAFFLGAGNVTELAREYARTQRARCATRVS